MALDLFAELLGGGAAAIGPEHALAARVLVGNLGRDQSGAAAVAAGQCRRNRVPDPGQIGVLRHRKKRISQAARRSDPYLQGRVLVHGIMPTPKGTFPTATVATTMWVAVRITETLAELAFAI